MVFQGPMTKTFEPHPGIRPAAIPLLSQRLQVVAFVGRKENQIEYPRLHLEMGDTTIRYLSSLVTPALIDNYYMN